MTDNEFVVIYIDRKISFIEETEKAYTAIIDSIPPFYEMIYDDKNFAEKLPAQHSEFVRRFYRSNVPEVRLRCSTVQELRTMEDNVKRKFSFRGSSEIIQTLSNLWLLRDYTVSDALNSLRRILFATRGKHMTYLSRVVLKKREKNYSRSFRRQEQILSKFKVYLGV
jgi:hypothetical protein